jgi:hypothetical protein
MTPTAFVDAADWVSIGFHAAVFVAVVVIVLAIQWLFDRRGGRP